MCPATMPHDPALRGMESPAPRPFRARGPARFAAATAILATLALPGVAAAIDLGDASVLSRQGQRLQLAIPFGSEPGERVAATRFQVVSVEAHGDGVAPDPKRFTISKPERRNVVYLRSEQPVHLEGLRIVLSVNEPGGTTTGAAYDIAIPPARFAPAKDPRSPRAPRPPRR